MNLVEATLQEVVGALQEGVVDSQTLVNRYLDAIEANNLKGKEIGAVLQVAPREMLIARAKQLDVTRAQGKVIGPLHGVPFLIKDSFDAVPELGFRTSAGTIALLESVPKKNAAIVQMLLDAGAIILGTTNMSIMSCTMGPTQPDGWSARGGQTQSPFGPGLNVGSSSTGCATGLAAGFCAAVVAEETCSSICGPANCQGLYGLKPTPDVVPKEGAVPLSERQDSLGVMGKSPWDLGTILNAIAKPSQPVDYVKSILEARPLSDFRVGMLRDAHPCTRDIDPNDHKLKAECETVYERIIGLLKPAVDPVQCPAIDYLVKEEGPRGWNSQGEWTSSIDALATFYDLGPSLDKYLKGREGGTIQTLEDLVGWNNAHPTKAFHPDGIDHSDRQLYFDCAVKLRKGHEDAYTAAIKQFATQKAQILDYMSDNKLDLILVMAGVLGMDCPAIGAPTELPVGIIPVGQLSNGSPVGMLIAGKPHDETTMLAYMAAAAKVLPSRPVPQM